jgi:two-component system response regulator WspF
LIRIGIVNDLRLAVEVLRRVVAAIPGATVAWIAEDGARAVAACARDLPDIVLMDMIMPVMDGVEATRRIMKATPCPILVVTATVEGNAGRVFEALGAGALDAVATPGFAPDGSLTNADPLVRKVNAIAVLAGATGKPRAEGPPTAPRIEHAAVSSMVAIGSSTGGPLALAAVIKALPRPAPWPIVIVQHVDPDFAPGLASWLGRETGHHVETIIDGSAPTRGRVSIAATIDHVVMGRDGRLHYTIDPKEAVFRPSVDVFFDSLLAMRAAPGVAVVLTGMGRDGAAGLLRLRNAGWHTIAQDQATSVVWGMPGASVEIGAAIQTLPIGEVGAAISFRMSFMSRGGPQP